LQNQQETVEQLWFRLQQYTALSSQSAGQLQQRVERLDREIKRKAAQQQDADNWLVGHLAKEEAHRRLLNSILHPEVTRLPKGQIRKPVQNASRLIKLFDGRLELPEDFPLQDLGSPEQLAEEVAELREERSRFQQLMDTARSYESLQKELETAKNQY